MRGATGEVWDMETIIYRFSADFFAVNISFIYLKRILVRGRFTWQSINIKGQGGTKTLPRPTRLPIRHINGGKTKAGLQQPRGDQI